MNRRNFLQLSSAAVSARLAALADTPLATAKLGKTGLVVTRLTLGGAHMRLRGEEGALRIIPRAIDLGINFFDSAHKYNNGESDAAYGKALAGGLRKKVYLMSKAEKRDAASAMRQLEETLTRMRTDYLDLWQCHEVVTQAEVDKIFSSGGALEAFVKAKQQGKVRHIGFTGHADPAVHLRLLKGFDGWETAQFPVNLIDRHYLSFIENVLPEVRRAGLGVIAMKSNGMGSITKHNVATIEECLRYSLSQPVDTLVSGVETVEQLEQNVLIAKTYKPLTAAEQSRLLERTAKGPTGPEIENYKRKRNSGALPAHRDGEFA
jgi:uncharacterized protein